MTVLGRIDIQHPDGRSESYYLGEDPFTVGSAAANTVSAPDAGLARLHIRFDQIGGAFFITNLAAGRRTTMDDRPVPVNEPQPLRDVTRIQAGKLQIVFNRGSDNPTVAMHTISDATQPSAVGFRAALDPVELKVWQYSSASAVLSVTNTRDNDALFSIETAGAPAEWTTPASLTFSVAANDAIDILLHVKPARRNDFAPGSYPLTITVHRLDEPEGAFQRVLLVRLGGFGGLSAALEPSRLRPGSPFNVYLLNLGNELLPLGLRLHDPDQLFNIKLAQAAYRLKAGERAVISATLALRRRPLFGKPAFLSCALLLEADEPHDYVVALPVTVAVRPRLERRLLIIAALAAAFVILAFAALLYQPPQPEITSFTQSDAIVAAGTPVDLRWSADQALSYVIEVDRAPVAELSAHIFSYTLETKGYDDPIDVALIALNGDATAIKTLRLNVYQPVLVRSFAADKSSLLRDISGDLTIGWRVEGAITLDIALPAGFETVRERIAGGEGEIIIEGVPTDDFQITLSAEDEIGGRTTRALPITMRDPECTPIQDVLLYAGPDSRFERASYAVRNVPVLASGRNADAEWLQIELANGERGWGFHINFRCHGFDPASLKVISDIPNLPKPTLTSTPLSALSPTETATTEASPASESTATLSPTEAEQ